MKKKILCLAFVLILCLSVFPFSVFASENDFSIDLTNTSIEDDFGKVFCGLLKPEEFVEKPMDDKLYYLISMEGCSSEGNNTELYFYVYNPSRKDIVKNSALNKLTLATYIGSDDSSANSYSKYDAKLVATHGAKEKSENTTDALLLKYEVNLNKSYDITQDRYYRIAEVELLIEGDTNATAFVAGKEYKFFNGENGAVNCSSKDLTTLEMDAFHTFYRVDTEGVDRYTDIHSIYFPVSNELLKTFGGMYALDLEWYKDTLNPALVVDSSIVRDEFQNNWISNRYSSFKYSLMYERYCPSLDLIEFYRNGVNVSALSSYTWLDWANPLKEKSYYYWNNHKLLLYPDVGGPNVDSDVTIGSVFYAHDVTTHEAVSIYGEEILSYINAQGDRASLYASKQLEATKQQFTVETIGNSYDKYVPRTGWLHNFAFWNWNTDKDSGEQVDVSVFETIVLSDLDKLSVKDFSNKYLVDINDVKCNTGKCENCINCRVNDDKYDDCTWFLLRYDTTFYQSYDAIVIDNETGNAGFNVEGDLWKVENAPCNAFVFESQLIRDFDTVAVTFKDVKDGVDVYSTFPILRSPTTFVADAWNPTKKPSFGNLFQDDKDFDWDKFLQILKIVVFVLVSLVLLRFILPIVKPIFKTFKRKIKERKNKRK